MCLKVVGGFHKRHVHWRAHRTHQPPAGVPLRKSTGMTSICMIEASQGPSESVIAAVRVIEQTWRFLGGSAAVSSGVIQESGGILEMSQLGRICHERNHLTCWCYSGQGRGRCKRCQGHVLSIAKASGCSKDMVAAAASQQVSLSSSVQAIGSAHLPAKGVRTGSLGDKQPLA